MSDEKNEKAIELAQWFVAVAGIIYVTGFLVTMGFADYLGAREAISEFLRAKYLNVGILCVALPLILIGGVYAVVELKSSMPEGRKLYGSSVILMFNLLFTFYTFVLFSPTGFLRNNPHLIWAIFGFTFGGIIAVQMLEKIVVPQKQEIFRSVARWIVCGVVLLGLDYYCFSEIASRLVEIFCVRGRIFLLLVATMAFFIGWLNYRMQFYTQPRAKRGVLVMAACIFGPLYFLTVLTFAYTIYPNIPASRGGGDFTEAPAVVVYYDQTHTNEIPTEINRSGVSQPLVLIEESEKWLVVADPEDGGGRKAWRDGDGKPQIYSINRDAVVSFLYQSRKLPLAKPKNTP